MQGGGGVYVFCVYARLAHRCKQLCFRKMRRNAGRLVLHVLRAHYTSATHVRLCVFLTAGAWEENKSTRLYVTALEVTLLGEILLIRKITIQRQTI